MQVIHKPKHQLNMGISPHHKSLLLLSGCASLALVGGVIFGGVNNDVLAESNTQDSNFTVEVLPNLTITVPESTTLQIKSSHDGTFGSTDVTATVDTSDGYTLNMYATNPLSEDGSTRTTSLINATNNTIDTITNDITEEVFSNKDNKEYNNKWGYKLNNSDGDNNYHPLTTEDMLIASSNEGGSFTNTITFGAKIDDTLPSGSYSTTLHFVATADVKPTTHTITIKPGTGIASVQIDDEAVCDDVSDGCDYELTEGSSHVLKATATSGYEFEQWTKASGSGTLSNETSSTEATFMVGDDAAILTANALVITQQITIKPSTGIWGVQLDSNTVCTSTSGCTYSLEPGTEHTLKASPTTSGYALSTWSNSTSNGTLSSPTSPTAAKFTVGDAATTLTATGKTVMNKCSGTTYSDSRGTAQTYAIATLADGKCWMLENLRLGGLSTITLTSGNTNLNTISSYTVPASVSSGFSDYAGHINVNSMDKTGSGGYASGKYGVYYDYCAVSAGTICGSSNTTEAQDDICPKGWRMPSKDEYSDLWNAYGNIYTGFVNALRTPLSGGFYGSSADYQGSDGGFWSTTSYNTSNRYGLYVASSSVVPTGNLIRHSGNSVRCVLK